MTLRLGRMLRRGLLALLLPTLLALSHPSAFADGVVTDAVVVQGRVAAPASFTVADLRRMVMHEVVISGDGGAKRVYRGVLLRDLLSACQPVEGTRFDLRQSVVLARASDGYLAVFSWIELFNSPIGDQVLVALDVDGVPLAEAEGHIALVSGADTRSGPRHVRWLSSIELLRMTT